MKLIVHTCQTEVLGFESLERDHECTMVRSPILGQKDCPMLSDFQW